MRFIDITKRTIQILWREKISFVIASWLFFIGGSFGITAPPLFFGIFIMSIKAYKGERTEFQDIAKGFDYFLKSWIHTLTSLLIAFALGVLMFVIVVGGIGLGLDATLLMLLMVLIIIMCAPITGILLVSIALMIDSGLDVSPSLKKAYQLVKQDLPTVFGLFLTTSILNILLGFTLIGLPLGYLVLTLAFSDFALSQKV